MSTFKHISIKFKKSKMKRVILFLLLAFVTFATTQSFADSSPPGVEISIDLNQLENPGIVEIQTSLEVARIAVYSSDLKYWPSFQKDGNTNLTVRKERGITIRTYITILSNNQNINFERPVIPANANQFIKAVCKFGITGKEVCYEHDNYSLSV